MTDTRRPRRDRVELPAGWCSVPLGDLLECSKEKVDPAVDRKAPYVGLEHIESGTRRLIGKGIAGDVRSTKNAFHSGELLYGKLRPYLKKVFRADSAGVCSTDILVLQPTEAVEPKMAERMLAADGFTEFAVATSAGISLPRTSYEKIAAFEVSLPPLPEQRRIVAKLEKLEGRVRRVREQLAPVPDLIAQARRSLLDAAFRGELSEDWRRHRRIDDSAKRLASLLEHRRRLSKGACNGRFSVTPSLVPSNRLPSIPRSWAWIDLDMAFSSLQNGIATPSEDEGVLPILRISAVRQMSVDSSAVRFLRRDVPEYKKYRLQANDLLFTRYNGNPDFVGVCGRVPRVKQALVYPDKLIRGRVVRRHICSGFVEAMANTGVARAHIRSCSKTAAGQVGISGADLKQAIIPFPPLPEQREIVRRLDRAFARLDAVAVAHKAAVKNLDTLEQSLLAKAFRGELVPQDPRDEPAAKLLERIRRRRTAAEASAPTVRKRGRRA